MRALLLSLLLKGSTIRSSRHSALPAGHAPAQFRFYDILFIAELHVPLYALCICTPNVLFIVNLNVKDFISAYPTSLETHPLGV